MRSDRQTGWPGEGRLLRSLLWVVLFNVLSCSDESPQAGRGTLTMALMSPNGDEAALLAELKGPGIVSVSEVEGRLHQHRRGDTVRVMLLHESTGQLRFSVILEDTLAVPRVDIIDVADGGNELRGDLASYSVEVVR